MTELSKRYVPAARLDLFLPIHDSLQWLLGGDAARAAPRQAPSGDIARFEAVSPS